MYKNRMHDQLNARLAAMKILEEQARWARDSYLRIQKEIGRLKSEVLDISQALDLPEPVFETEHEDMEVEYREIRLAVMTNGG